MLGSSARALGDGGEGAAVQPVGLGHLDQPAAGSELGHGLPEAGLALLLAVEGAAGQRHQHAAGIGAGRLGDQVGRGRPGGAVVDAHVRRPDGWSGTSVTRVTVGIAGRGQLVDRSGDQGVVGGLEQDAVAAPALDPLQGGHHVGGVALLRRWNRARSTAGRSCGSSASSAARTASLNRRGASITRSTRKVCPASRTCSRLPVQVGDGLPHLGPGALPDARPVVQHPIHRRLAQPGLLRDLPHPVRVPLVPPLPAVRPLRGFCRRPQLCVQSAPEPRTPR